MSIAIVGKNVSNNSPVPHNAFALGESSPINVHTTVLDADNHYHTRLRTRHPRAGDTLLPCDKQTALLPAHLPGSPEADTPPLASAAR